MTLKLIRNVLIIIFICSLLTGCGNNDAHNRPSDVPQMTANDNPTDHPENETGDNSQSKGDIGTIGNLESGKIKLEMIGDLDKAGYINKYLGISIPFADGFTLTSGRKIYNLTTEKELTDILPDLNNAITCASAIYNNGERTIYITMTQGVSKASLDKSFVESTGADGSVDPNVETGREKLGNVEYRYTLLNKIKDDDDFVKNYFASKDGVLVNIALIANTKEELDSLVNMIKS